MGTIQVFDPTTEAREQSMVYAPRPDSLSGKRVGLVENTKFNSDVLLLKIGKVLEDEYGAAGSVLWRKLNSSVPAHEEILEDARGRADVVLAGIGD
ncbi:MAG: hypothetical protein ACE5JN_04275 [Candidatus Methylomirabilia bacterium]